MSVVQGGCGLPFLAESVFQYLCDASSHSIRVDPTILSNGVLRTVIYKVRCFVYTLLSVFFAVLLLCI